jgi:hypothetical protein
MPGDSCLARRFDRNLKLSDVPIFTQSFTLTKGACLTFLAIRTFRSIGTVIALCSIDSFCTCRALCTYLSFDPLLALCPYRAGRTGQFVGVGDKPPVEQDGRTIEHDLQRGYVV